MKKIEIQTIFMDNMKAIEKMFPEEIMEYYKLEVELYQAKEERYRLFIEEVNKQNKELKVLLNYFNSNNPSVKKYLELSNINGSEKAKKQIEKLMLNKDVKTVSDLLAKNKDVKRLIKESEDEIELRTAKENLKDAIVKKYVGKKFENDLSM